MEPRVELARELLTTCPPDAYCDYCRVVEALDYGYSPEDILSMAQVKRWPETYAWLKAKFEH